MSRNLTSMVLGLALLAGMAAGIQTARAEEDWKTIGKFSAKGDAKEAVYDGKINQFRIYCTEPPVIVNTVVVRLADGGTKKFTVGKEFTKKEERHVIKFDEKTHIKGIRISDDKEGSYIVQVK